MEIDTRPFSGMSDLEDDVQRLREQQTDISNRLIRMEERVISLCRWRDRKENNQESKEQRVPVLLLGAIAATSGAVSVLFQLWVSRGP